MGWGPQALLRIIYPACATRHREDEAEDGLWPSGSDDSGLIKRPLTSEYPISRMLELS